MVVVLAEFLHAEQAVHLAGFLFSVQDVILAVADRQLLVGVDGPLVSHHGVRAVHRLRRHGVFHVAVVDRSARLHLHGLHFRRLLLQVVGDARDLRVGLQPAGDAGDHEHVVDVVRPVAADEPQFLIVDEGRRDLGVAVPLLQLAGELQQLLVHLPAAGQPVRHAGRRLVEHEQLELRAELLVVALLRLADQVLVLLQRLFVRERVRVDAQQGIPVLVASPVGAGRAADLERRAHQQLGVVHVRAAAQVDVIVAGVVDRDDLVLGQVLDQFLLELLVREKGQSLFLRDLLPRPVLAALDDLTHLILDGLEIILRDPDAFRHQEVIVESVRDLRADRVLHFLPVQLDHGLRENVRERMPVALKIL